MIVSTTIGGLTFDLLGIEPNGPVSADVDVLSDLVAGLSNRETRRPYSSTLRFSKVAYSATLTAADAREVAKWLRTYQTGSVGLPFWPGMVRWADRASQTLTSKLKLVFKPDWSQSAVYDDVEPGWCAAGDYVCPLLIGTLERRELRWATADTAELAVEFSEASTAAYALTPSTQVWTAGPAPSVAWVTAPKLFPFQVDFQQQGQNYRVGIQVSQVGFGREPLRYLYAQTNAEESSVSETLLTAADVGKLLRWFLDYGTGKAFWCPTWTAAAVLNAAVNSAGLSVEDVGAVEVGDWLALIENDTVGTGLVTDTDTGSITLADDPGDFTTNALLCRLLLCRLDKTRFSISWPQPGVATCNFAVVEVPPEYTPAADETLNTSISLLPTRCYLYELSRTLNGTTYTDRFTSFESALTYGGNTYAVSKMTHGEIRQGIALDRDEVTLTAAVVAGSALVLLATMKLEAPLFLTIRQGDVSGSAAANTAVVFTGEIVGCSIRGQIISAKAVSGGTLYDRNVPRMLFQRSCNHALFSTGCGLLKTNWSFTATVSTPGDAGYPFEFGLTALQDRSITIPEGFFAGGWMELGSAENWQRRAILLSTAPSGGALTVTLDRDPDPYPEADDAVVLYPGCDGSVTTCKFLSNYLNFGGHPFLPMANPSFTKKNESIAGGKK